MFGFLDPPGPTLEKFAKDGPFMRIFPMVSALVVTLMGAIILIKAVSDAGWLT